MDNKTEKKITKKNWIDQPKKLNNTNESNNQNLKRKSSRKLQKKNE